MQIPTEPESFLSYLRALLAKPSLLTYREAYLFLESKQKHHLFSVLFDYVKQHTSSWPGNYRIPPMATEKKQSKSSPLSALFGPIVPLLGRYELEADVYDDFHLSSGEVICDEFCLNLYEEEGELRYYLVEYVVFDAWNHFSFEEVGWFSLAQGENDMVLFQPCLSWTIEWSQTKSVLGGDSYQVPMSLPNIRKDVIAWSRKFALQGETYHKDWKQESLVFRPYDEVFFRSFEDTGKPYMTDRDGTLIDAYRLWDSNI